MTWGEWRLSGKGEVMRTRSKEDNTWWQYLTPTYANAAEAVIAAAREVVLPECAVIGGKLAITKRCLTHNSRWPCEVEELRQALTALEEAER